MLEIGSVLDGKYKILNEIGHGGMSVVYLALNERANKTWAVKEVRKDGGNDNEVVSQGLIAETEMLKKLHHPNLPSIVDVIDTEDSFIIVMDYIEGRSLQDLLDTSGPQPVDLVVDWAKQLCDVLIDLKGIQGYGTFALAQRERIARTAYFEAMKILKNHPLIKTIAHGNEQE